MNNVEKIDFQNTIIQIKRENMIMYEYDSNFFERDIFYFAREFNFYNVRINYIKNQYNLFINTYFIQLISLN